MHCFAYLGLVSDGLEHAESGLTQNYLIYLYIYHGLDTFNSKGEMSETVPTTWPDFFKMLIETGVLLTCARTNTISWYDDDLCRMVEGLHSGQ